MPQCSTVLFASPGPGGFVCVCCCKHLPLIADFATGMGMQCYPAHGMGMPFVPPVALSVLSGIHGRTCETETVMHHCHREGGARLGQTLAVRQDSTVSSACLRANISLSEVPEGPRECPAGPVSGSLYTSEQLAGGASPATVPVSSSPSMHLVRCTVECSVYALLAEPSPEPKPVRRGTAPNLGLPVPTGWGLRKVYGVGGSVFSMTLAPHSRPKCCTYPCTST
jgi:hypothetical protein